MSDPRSLEQYDAMPRGGADLYPPPAAPSKQLPEPPAGLAIGAIVAACCLLFVELAELVILLVTSDRGEAGVGYLVVPELDPNNDTVTLVFGLAAYLAACLWLRASRRFAEAANPAATFEHGPGWTWLGWWVPVVSLWIPYRVVRDIRGAVLSDGARRVAIGLWWPLWLLGGLRIVASATGDAELIVRAVAAVALLLALIHWVRIIRETTTAQEKLAGFV